MFLNNKKSSLLIMFILCILCSSDIFSQNKIEITVLYTGSLRGNLSGCECTVKPNSGLVRRVSAIKSLMGKSAAETILLDTGDMLGFSDNSEKSSYILKIFQNQKYDAIVPGYQDITHSSGLVEKNKYSLPLIGSAKIHRIRKSVLINRGGMKTGVIGYISPKVFSFSSKSPSDYGLSYSTDYITEEANRLRSEGAEFIILLAHSRRDAAKELSEIKEVDAVIAGNDQYQPAKPGDTQINGKYVLSPGGDDGEFIGKLVLAKNNGRVSIVKNELIAVHSLNPGHDPAIKDWLQKHPEYNVR